MSSGCAIPIWVVRPFLWRMTRWRKRLLRAQCGSLAIVRGPIWAIGSLMTATVHTALGMALKNGDKRRAKIEELLAKGKDKSWVQERKSIFLDILTKIWTELVEMEVHPGEIVTGRSALPQL